MIDEFLEQKDNREDGGWTDMGIVSGVVIVFDLDSQQTCCSFKSAGVGTGFAF